MLISNGIIMAKSKINKEEYKEIQDLIKAEMVDLKTYLKETFETKIHCGKKRGQFSIYFITIAAISIISLGERGYEFIMKFKGG